MRFELAPGSLSTSRADGFWIQLANSRKKCNSEFVEGDLANDLSEDSLARQLKWGGGGVAGNRHSETRMMILVFLYIFFIRVSLLRY